MLKVIDRINARTQLSISENESRRDWSIKVVRCKECNIRYRVGFSMDFEYCPEHSKKTLLRDTVEA